MSVLNQSFEHYIGKVIKKLNNDNIVSTAHSPIIIGMTTQLIPYIKRDLNSQKEKAAQSFTNNTLVAFKQLESTDWVAYDKTYHIGFPVGIGCLKYYQAINDPTKPFPNTDGLMDIPDGADEKLTKIIEHKDPFKYSPEELKARLHEWLEKAL